MGCEALGELPSAVCTIVSYKHIGGKRGRRSPLRDFPPELTDFRIRLCPSGARGANAICVLKGGLGQCGHPRSALWEAAEKALWSLDTLQTRGSSQPQYP